MRKSNKLAIIFFTRDPSKESTIKHLVGSKRSNLLLWQEIYKNTLNKLRSIRSKVSFDLFITTHRPKTKFIDFQELGDITYLPQNSEQFQNNLDHAFATVFKLGYSDILVIGNDCLELSESSLIDAVSKLKRHDVVIGPSLDGGFYLLGLHEYNHAFFANIEWYTAKVYQQILQNMTAFYTHIAFLNPLGDIDSPQDIFAWYTYAKDRLKNQLIYLLNDLIHITVQFTLYLIPFVHKKHRLKRNWQKAPPSQPAF